MKHDKETMEQLDALKEKMMLDRLHEYLRQGRKKEVKAILNHLFVSKDDYTYTVYCPKSGIRVDYTTNSIYVLRIKDVFENKIRKQKLKALE
jgi:hypothetical protein